MEHSIRFPLPLGFHIGFILVSVILLILCYQRRRHAYELYMMIGVASTALIYIASERIVFYILGIEEFVLLFLTIFDMCKVSKENAAAENEPNKNPAAPKEENEAISSEEESEIEPGENNGT